MYCYFFRRRRIATFCGEKDGRIRDGIIQLLSRALGPWIRNVRGNDSMLVVAHRLISSAPRVLAAWVIFALVILPPWALMDGYKRHRVNFSGPLEVFWKNYIPF